MKIPLRLLAIAAVAAVLSPSRLHAWGAEGHEMVNQLALSSLPADFPRWALTPANARQVVFLANEPDFLRDSKDRMMLHAATVDHDFDLEEIADAGMDVATLSPFRYEFAVQFAAARAAHVANFRPIEPQYNGNHTAGFPGFLPWTIAEYYGQLQQAFSCVKTFEKYGTPDEVAGARANALWIMAVMGHFVGDGSQPLHVSKYFYGWTGPNPKGYVSRGGWHGWIDSGAIEKAGITAAELLPRVRPAVPVSVAPRPDGRDPVFVAVVDYLKATNLQLIPLYQLEKDGPLRMGVPPTAEGRAFIDDRLLDGGEMLGSLWLTAWRHAGPDYYLQSRLLRRNAATHPAAP